MKPESVMNGREPANLAMVPNGSSWSFDGSNPVTFATELAHGPLSVAMPRSNGFISTRCAPLNLVPRNSGVYMPPIPPVVALLNGLAVLNCFCATWFICCWAL